MQNQDSVKYMHEAAKVAKKALCLRAKCGTVIVKDNQIIGKGYNAPPLDDPKNRTCLDEFPPGKPKYDRTCCMHAEWRAIMDALRHHPNKVKESVLYFTRVDEKGEIIKSGKPFCTVCSRLALDSDIKTFVLWHEDGFGMYPTDEYNKLSYQYTNNDSIQELIIQPVKAGDLNAVWNIIETCADWLADEKGLDHWKKYYTKEKVAEKIKAHKVFLARLQDAVIATVTVSFEKVNYYTDVDMKKFADPSAKAGYISSLAVIPEFQNRGIASYVMKFAEEKIAEENALYIRLDCRASYKELVEYYVHRSFKTLGPLERFPEFVLMEKPL